jgi:hypothetical protein
MSIFRKLKKQVSIKNINPVAKVVSVIKPTAKKVIDTRKVGIKDFIAISPIGLASNLTNTGVSQITDIVVDKPIIPKPEVDTFANAPVVDTSITEPAKPSTSPLKETPETTTKPKPKSNTLMYAGIGVGVLVLGYFGYKLIKK